MIRTIHMYVEFRFILFNAGKKVLVYATRNWFPRYIMASIDDEIRIIHAASFQLDCELS